MRAAQRGRGRETGRAAKGTDGRQKGNKTITKQQINGIIEILFLIEKIVGIIGPRSRYYRTPHGTTAVSVVGTFTCRAYAVPFARLRSAPRFSTVSRRLPSIFSNRLRLSRRPMTRVRYTLFDIVFTFCSPRRRCSRRA